MNIHVKKIDLMKQLFVSTLIRVREINFVHRFTVGFFISEQYQRKIKPVLSKSEHYIIKLIFLFPMGVFQMKKCRHQQSFDLSMVHLIQQNLITF